MKKIRIIIFFIIGIVSLTLSYKCFTYHDLQSVTTSVYGGDAYTGIQNATAVTSKNVAELANIVNFGFGSVLLVSGLTFIGIALTMPLGQHKKTEVPSVETK